MRMRQETFKKSYYIPAFGKSIEIRRNQDIDEEGVLGKELLAQYGEDCILEGETKTLMEKVVSGEIGGSGISLTTEQTAAIAKIKGLEASASEIDLVTEKNVYPSMSTEEIQEVINKKGKIVFTDGLYLLTDTLYQGDYTHIELMPNAILSHTIGKTLIKNSNVVLGNIGLALTGGTLNYNYPLLNAIDAHNSHSVVYQNVTGLRLENQTGKNSQKYIYLLSSINDFYSNNITLDTISDGLHFMGPANNISVNNTRGRTDDNMVAFTIGDYASYEISAGNMTNITVKNTYCNNSAEPVRFVGKTGYYFDKIVIDGVFGIVNKGSVISIIQDGSQLDYTEVKTLSLKNIMCETITGSNIKIDGIKVKELNIDTVVIKNNLTGNIIDFKGNTNVEIASINNITIPSAFTGQIVSVSGKVNTLNVSNINIPTTYSLINVAASGIVKRCNLLNIAQTLGNYLFFVSGVIKEATILNSNITSTTLFLKKNTSTQDTLLMVLNTAITSTSTMLINLSTAATELRALCENTTTLSATTDVVYREGGGKISANGKTFYIQDIAQLTPKNYDIVYNPNAAYLTGAGLYVYKNSAWVAL